LVWTIDVSKAAARELAAFDRTIARSITTFLRERVANLPDPRSIGEALKGQRLGGLWKYRVDDWRVVVSIEDETITVVVLRVGHRREVYR
jgi:mRNA interferase RelE/StbE